MVISFCETPQEEEADGVEEKRKGRREEEGTDVVTVAFGSTDPEQQIVLPTERINATTYVFFAPGEPDHSKQSLSNSEASILRDFEHGGSWRVGRGVVDGS